MKNMTVKKRQLKPSYFTRFFIINRILKQNKSNNNTNINKKHTR